jgi:hypothetical protein
MADLNGFNAADVEPDAGYSPVPPNKYLTIITDSQMKPTKSGNGQYLELEFEIIEGDYKGRHLWARLNLDNPNATAVKIARGQLSALCRSISVLTPRDSCELHNLPLLITVAVKRNKETDTLTNEIRAFEPRNASSAKSPPTNGSRPAAGVTPPWKR